ncbi:MAG: 50S ribosomal protein L32e [Euryarchaeota archaeon]|nr:50S ribosomal protein L32e [Euryarchaeota archaeon]|tara:strand:+ start:13843 stop:14493 length:651 start_codon:yes stop_codon:yes gene_type:complete
MSEYENMTVAELKELLKEAGLPVSGKKADLIARLVDSQEEDVSTSEDEMTEEELDDEEEDFEDDYEDEDWDDEDIVEEHVARQKPVLSDDLKASLALRAAQKKGTPKFRRTEWFRYKRLSRSGWRKPHGMDNKQRRNFKYRGSLVRIGHGKVNAASGLHPSGFEEVMVHNSRDLDVIDAETQAARIGSTVGGRKREMIHSRADELGIRVLNRRRER